MTEAQKTDKAAANQKDDGSADPSATNPMNSQRASFAAGGPSQMNGPVM